MLSVAEWQSLVYLKPSDFKRPDGLQFSIVQALDRFIGEIGSRPVILSDYRPGDPLTHGAGLAVDTTWPGVDSLRVYNKAIAFPAFHGVGVYINELGVVSFHFDTRLKTLRIDEPDRWGGVITHPLNTATGQYVRRTEYVGASTVLDMIKKKSIGMIIFLALFGYATYLYISRK